MKYSIRAITLVTIMLTLVLSGCRSSTPASNVAEEQNISITHSNQVSSQTTESDLSQNPETIPTQTHPTVPQEIAPQPQDSTESTLSQVPSEETIPPTTKEDEPLGETEHRSGQHTESESTRTQYVKILSEEGTFFSQSYQQELTISGYLNEFASQTGTEPKVTKYTILDMDEDGVIELLLWITINEYSDYGTMVLRFQNGHVEEYTFAYRQLFDLKTDGSFAFSGSSSDGYARLVFDINTWQYQEIADKGQDEKEVVQWHSYPDTNYSEIIQAN